MQRGGVKCMIQGVECIFVGVKCMFWGVECIFRANIHFTPLYSIHSTPIDPNNT